MKRKPTVGELGWIGLTVYVLAVDSIAWRRNNETMSVAFGKGLQHPKARWATMAAWGVVTAHLFWRLPLPLQNQIKSAVLHGMKEGTIGNTGIDHIR